MHLDNGSQSRQQAEIFTKYFLIPIFLCFPEMPKMGTKNSTVTCHMHLLVAMTYIYPITTRRLAIDRTISAWWCLPAGCMCQGYLYHKYEMSLVLPMNRAGMYVYWRCYQGIFVCLPGNTTIVLCCIYNTYLDLLIVHCHNIRVLIIIVIYLSPAQHNLNKAEMWPKTPIIHYYHIHILGKILINV